MAKYRIFVEIAEISSSGYYRSMLPVKMLHAELAEADIEVLCSDKINDNVNGLFDCYVYSRVPNWKVFAHAIEQARRKAKIIWDLDDDFKSIPDWSPAKAGFGSEELVYLRESLAMADKVICSTKPLAASTVSWYPFTKNNTVVLENLVYPTPFFRQIGSLDLIKILWTGSKTHVGDMGPLKAVSEFIRINPGYLLVIYGDIPEWMTDTRNTVHVPWGPKMYYESIMSMIAPDIALLPLIDCRFNRCKSAIKFYECTLAGALCLASDTTPFKDVIADQITGLVLPHEDHDKWISAIKDYKTRFNFSESTDISDMKTNARREVMESYSWTSDNPLRRAWKDFYLGLPG